jgi:hypothetical protein
LRIRNLRQPRIEAGDGVVELAGNRGLAARSAAALHSEKIRLGIPGSVICGKNIEIVVTDRRLQLAQRYPQFPVLYQSGKTFRVCQVNRRYLLFFIRLVNAGEPLDIPAQIG